jgi:hypothetical protein
MAIHLFQQQVADRVEPVDARVHTPSKFIPNCSAILMAQLALLAGIRGVQRVRGVRWIVVTRLRGGVFGGKRVRGLGHYMVNPKGALHLRIKLH